MLSRVICVGAALVDEIYYCSSVPQSGTSNPADLKKMVGGVMANVARQLALLNCDVSLITAIGNDSEGEWVTSVCENAGVDTTLFQFCDHPTAKYTAILDPDGSLFTAACNSRLDEQLSPAILQELYFDIFLNTSLILADANLGKDSLQWLIQFSASHNIQLIIDPVSVEKAAKFRYMDLNQIKLLTPNTTELVSLCEGSYDTEEGFAAELLSRGVQQIWVRKGSEGSVLYSQQGAIRVPAPVVTKVVNETGAGDASLAGWVAASLSGYTSHQSLFAGHAVAAEVIQLHSTIYTNNEHYSIQQLIQKYYPYEF